MIDYTALPPEVNSGRMYAGAGAAPLMAAATAWDRLAATLGSAAGAYRGVVFELTDTSWQGPASASMTAAAEPYVQWMHATAAQAAQTANQARAAAAAYEAALAATVPPPVIAANRAALASLQATNVFGQNSAAIAANQADYGEMWAQDAAAMHAYAASSAAATTLTTFTPAPQTTNPTGTANQAGTTAAQTATTAATQAANPIADFLNNNPLAALLHSPLFTGGEQLFNSQTGLLTAFLGVPGFDGASILLGGPDFPVMGAVSAAMLYSGLTGQIPAYAMSATSGAEEQFTLAGSSATAAGAAGGPAAVGSAAAEAAAGFGRAAPVGELSVPPSWGAATPQGARLAATALPMSASVDAAALPVAGIPASAGRLGGIPPVVSVVNAPRNGESRVRPDAEAVPQTAKAGSLDADARYRSELVAGVRGALSEREQLNRLRHAVAELATQRDALERSAASMVEEAMRR